MNIIDANVHITPEGDWFGTGHDASLGTLLRQMDEEGISRAALLGLTDAASNDLLLEAGRLHRGTLLPVAGFDPSAYTSPEEAAETAGALLAGGEFVGLKLHPRFNRYLIDDLRVRAVLERIASLPRPRPVWLCSFLHFKGGVLPKSPVEMLHELVGSFPGLTFVLLHAGGTDALRLAQALRDMPNAFLDLSWTLSRYRGSSVEQDLRFLLSTFDRRLIFGSDFPEISLGRAKKDFFELARGVDEEKVRAILGGNLERLIGKGAP